MYSILVTLCLIPVDLAYMFWLALKCGRRHLMLEQGQIVLLHSLIVMQHQVFLHEQHLHYGASKKFLAITFLYAIYNPKAR